MKPRSDTGIRDVKLSLAKCLELNHDHMRVGEYVRFRLQPGTPFPATNPPDATTTIPCPFCEKHLSRPVLAPGTGIGRIVVECTGGPQDPCDGEVAIMPDTHRVLVCRSCKQIFTEVA